MLDGGATRQTATSFFVLVLLPADIAGIWANSAGSGGVDHHREPNVAGGDGGMNAGRGRGVLTV